MTMSMDELRAADLEGMGDYRDEIAGMSGKLKRRANGKVKAAKSFLNMNLGKARKGAGEAMSRAREGAADLYDELDSVLKARPLVTLGVGVAIGAIAALAISRLVERE
jgi:ElaB/YqjD/DUF883 family membrane-anchored ribosome-binding protein